MWAIHCIFHVWCTPALNTENKNLHGQRFCKRKYFFFNLKRALQLFLNRVLRKVLIFLTSDWNIKLVKWLGVFFIILFCFDREREIQIQRSLLSNTHKHTNHKYTNRRVQFQNWEYSNFLSTRRNEMAVKTSCAMALWTEMMTYHQS